jgi:hypothetical protein|nr:MAG TPA: hypothetical protein [Caudoviricetes sp.]
MNIKDLSGAEIEARLKDEAINVTPETFVEAYDKISQLLKVQNERARKVAKGFGKTFEDRRASDVFRYYRIARTLNNLQQN